MHFPSELVLAILKPLTRPDLKSARLVSKIWSLCAAEYLFNVIYISPSKENIDVFEAITQHPVLSKCPRHLEYDGAEFLTNYSVDECIEDLERYKDCDIVDIVDDGYQEYQEHANYQQAVLESGQFFEILVRGLQPLVSLASVTLQPHWPWNSSTNSRDISRGSPLARSWNRFYPDPCGWSFTYGRNGQRGPDGARQCLIISSALARARKQIRKFGLGHSAPLIGGLPPDVFDRSDHSSTGLDITAFPWLEHFDITLACYTDIVTPRILNNVHGLQLLLDSMDQLKFLRLRLSSDYDEGPTLYNYENVFSAAKVWSRLMTLKLEFMSTTATQLLLLLVFQMPEMRHLELGYITLLEGTWHSVIEGLKQSNRLSSFRIPYNSVLVHRSGRSFMYSSSQFLEPIEEYMMHGGHHPCIPPNQPHQAARIYRMDIEPSVRDRLMGLDSTRCEELDSAARKALMDARNKGSRCGHKLDGSQASWEKLVEMDSYHLTSNFTL
ncbi:MAG: hypothetical protein Q9161_009681 [Pseudevernia consocians]